MYAFVIFVDIYKYFQTGKPEIYKLYNNYNNNNDDCKFDDIFLFQVRTPLVCWTPMVNA